MIRCKFKCVSHTEFVSYNNRSLHKASFSPVTDGSEENKKFYDATPGGRFEIETMVMMPFKLGASYYIDIEEAS